MTVHVDVRWVGEHGIGRFAREVIARLDFPYRAVRSTLRPAHPLDVVAGWRLRPSGSDLVFSPGFNAGLTRARQLLVLHDLIHLEFGGRMRRRYFSSVVAPVIRASGVVLTVSEASKDRIEAWLDAPQVDVVNVGNACAPAFEGRGLQPSSGACESFLFVGNGKEHKNLTVVLRALRLRPHYSLVAVVPDVDRVRGMVRETGLDPDAVVIASGVPDERLADLYASSRGLVMPSLTEGFGYPALESMECGTRTAYWSGCDTVREICGPHGVAVASADDPAEWATALDRLADDSRVPASAIAPRDSWSDVAGRVNDVVRRCAPA